MDERTLRVAFLADTISRKGAGVAAAMSALVNHLACRRNLNIFIYSYEDEYSMEELKNFHRAIKIEMLPNNSLTRFIRSHIVERLLHDEIDVVHQHGIWTPLSLATTHWHEITRRPYIVSTHGMLDPWALKRSRWRKQIFNFLIERRTLSNASCIHAFSSEIGGLRALGVNNNYISIPNGIDVAETHHSKNKNIQHCEDTKHKNLIYLGRLHEKKGVLESIQAYGEARRLSDCVRKEWRFLIYGDGDTWYKKRLSDEIKKHNLERDVIMLGPVYGQDKVHALVNADAFVLGSRSEGVPMAVLEAWAFSLPVFMTRACNLCRAFETGGAIEIRVSPLQQGQIIAHHLELDSLAGIGKEGRKLAMTHYSWTSIAQSFEKLYRWSLDFDVESDQIKAL